MKMRLLAACVALILTPVLSLSAEEQKGPDYRKQIAPIFRKYCNGCHNKKDAEGELVLDSFPKLLQGGREWKSHRPRQGRQKPACSGAGEKSRAVYAS